MVQDPDVLRWGLHTLMDNCCVPTAAAPFDAVTRYEAGAAPVGFVSEGYCHREDDDVESDAVIARALQEEYSRVAAAEASGTLNPAQDSILRQDWPRDRGSLGDGEVGNSGRIWEDFSGKTGDDASVSTGGEQCKDLLHIWDDDDESARDGEVGKRLNEKMNPMPHVPKINGEIPSEDQETSDHQRLLERLKVYELVENKVQGDGNCQFRAISDQLYHSPEHHKHVREQVVDQLKSYPETYEGYVPMAYNNYMKKMSKSGEWGDHVTLQAAADSFGVKIFVITSFKDTCYIEILPQIQKSSRASIAPSNMLTTLCHDGDYFALMMRSSGVIFLSFWAEVHYNSIYPEGELPLLGTKKKKWWMLAV